MCMKRIYSVYLKLLILFKITSLSVQDVPTEIISNYGYDLKVANAISDMCVVQFPDIRVFSIIFTENYEPVSSTLLEKLGQKNILTVIFDVNSRYRGYISDEIAVSGSENDLVLCFVSRWGELKNMVEENSEYHWIINSRVLIFIEDLRTYTHLGRHITLPISLAAKFVKLAVMYIRKGVQSNYAIDDVKSQSHRIYIETYNPLLKFNHGKEVPLEKLYEANDVLREAYSPTKLWNLHATSLRVTTLHANTPPMFGFKKIDSGYLYEGYIVKVYEALRQKMNYTVQVVRINEPKKYGRRQKNGNWTGVVGDLTRKEADIAYADVLMNYERYQVIDFSDFFHIHSSAILVHKSKQIPPWKSMLIIYNFRVLLLIFVVFIIMIATSKIFHLFLPVNENQNLSQVCLQLFGIYLQCSVAQPVSNSMRILYFIWIYFSLVIASLYTGSIVSVLTIPRYYRDIDTLQQLVESKIIPTGNKFYHKLLNDKSNSALHTLYKQYQPDGHYEELVKRISEGKKIALLTSEPTIKYYMKKFQSCPSCNEEFHILKDTIGNLNYAISFPNESVLIGRVNTLVRRMRGCGLISKWYLDEIWQLNLKHACRRECDVNKAISLNDLHSSFYIWLSGLIFSLLIFILEVIPIGGARNDQIL